MNQSDSSKITLWWLFAINIYKKLAIANLEPVPNKRHSVLPLWIKKTVVYKPVINLSKFTSKSTTTDFFGISSSDIHNCIASIHQNLASGDLKLQGWHIIDEQNKE